MFLGYNLNYLKVFEANIFLTFTVYQYVCSFALSSVHRRFLFKQNINHPLVHCLSDPIIHGPVFFLLTELSFPISGHIRYWRKTVSKEWRDTHLQHIAKSHRFPI